MKNLQFKSNSALLNLYLIIYIGEIRIKNNIRICYLTSILINESGIKFKIIRLYFYSTVPLVLRSSRRIIEAITGY